MEVSGSTSTSHSTNSWRHKNPPSSFIYATIQKAMVLLSPLTDTHKKYCVQVWNGELCFCFVDAAFGNENNVAFRIWNSSASTWKWCNWKTYKQQAAFYFRITILFSSSVCARLGSHAASSLRCTWHTGIWHADVLFRWRCYKIPNKYGRSEL